VAQSEANVTSWSKGYSKPWSPIPGSHEGPQLELEGYLRAIMLEAYFAGGYLCPKLVTFEPKVVTKIHPGAERLIMRSGGSSSKALPGAVESILGQKRLSLKLLKPGALQSHPGALEDIPRALETLPGSL
jgi:hypothetical protein